MKLGVSCLSDYLILFDLKLLKGVSNLSSLSTIKFDCFSSNRSTKLHNYN